MSQAPSTPQISRAPTSTGSLSVPGASAAPASSKTLTRPGSHSSLRRSIEHEDDLVPHSRSVSRRNSESDAGVGSTGNNAAQAHPAQPTQQQGAQTHTEEPKHAASANSPGAPVSAAAHAGLTPLLPGSMQARAENAALTSPVDWVEPDHLAAAAPGHERVAIFFGKGEPRRHINTPKHLLAEKSPYMKKIIDAAHGSDIPYDKTTFEEFDEFGAGLFQQWLTSHGKLHGPHDFHSLHHYLNLYVLAKKLEIEGLQNQTLDLIRHYYASQNMTAPAYRLEYIYQMTHGDNAMRRFMINTAAFRALEEAPRQEITAANPMLHKTFYAPGSSVSESIKGVIAKNPELATDFVEALHVHEQTKKCKEQRLEPWQSDGADDAKPDADKKDDKPKDDKPKDDKDKEEAPKAPGGPSAPKAADVPKPAAPAAPAVKPADPPKPAAPAVKPADSPKPVAPSHAPEPPKDDDNAFKRFGKGLKDKMHAAKEKVHKPDAHKPDCPKPDVPKADVPKKPDAPKAVAPKPDAPKK